MELWLLTWIDWNLMLFSDKWTWHEITQQLISFQIIRVNPENTCVIYVYEYGVGVLKSTC